MTTSTEYMQLCDEIKRLETMLLDSGECFTCPECSRVFHREDAFLDETEALNGAHFCEHCGPREVERRADYTATYNMLRELR